MLAWAAGLLAAAPVQAGEVILVKGGEAVRVNDPDVPAKREISLGPPIGGRAPLATTASRRGRAARAW
ncbi:MAG: hypothetical protein ACRDN8_10450, partial [Thermoleophilaceae bacterium]